jgi:RNA polymerase sigma-70 factor (ECF subfamily)
MYGPHSIGAASTANSITAARADKPAGAARSADSAGGTGRTAYDSRLGIAPPTPIGFRVRSTFDDSPAALRQTQLAVTRAKQGDREALRFLYIRYSHNVYGYVRSIVRDEHEAEDVTQHVFTKLMTVLSKYDDRGIPFFAWLLRLARNLAIDHLRANRAIPCEEVLSGDTQGGEHDIDAALTVRAALATLPDDQRQVVILRHVMGMTPGEIATRMGRTEGSIHGLHHRGRRALQQELRRLESSPQTRTRHLKAA